MAQVSQQLRQHASLGLIGHVTGRPCREQALRGLAIDGSPGGLAAAQFRLDARISPDPLRDAWHGRLTEAEQRHRHLHTWGLVLGQPR
jgi:hypothetical protein